MLTLDVDCSMLHQKRTGARIFGARILAAACGQIKHKGDGWCDDDNNNAGCAWDGGDCCKGTVTESKNSNVKTGKVVETACKKVGL